MSKFSEVAHVSTRRFNGYRPGEAIELGYEALLARAQREGKPHVHDGKQGFTFKVAVRREFDELFADLGVRDRRNMVEGLKGMGNLACLVHTAGLSTWWISATLLRRDLLEYAAKNGGTPDQIRERNRRTRARAKQSANGAAVQPAPEPVPEPDPAPKSSDVLAIMRQVLAAAEESEVLRAENQALKKVISDVFHIGMETAVMIRKFFGDDFLGLGDGDENES